MAANDCPPEPLPVIDEGGRLFVPVDWRHAEGLQTYLRREGFPSTLHLNPAAREARLELWAGADPAQLKAALGRARNHLPGLPLLPAA
jgi:hypothetical protein